MTATAMPSLEPVTLQGRYVRLEPLSLQHVNELTAAGCDPELWRWVPSAGMTEPAQLRAYVETALDEARRGVSLPFATVNLSTGKAIGSTRFANIALPDRRLEIGWTWIAARHQRSGINTEAKTLMLSHAFDTLGINRVELKTDALNAKSRAAIARIGATQEGIFRQHMVMPDGRLRDTVYFSIIRPEWPAVRTRLQALLR